MVSWIKVILLMGVTYVYKLYKCFYFLIDTNLIPPV